MHIPVRNLNKKISHSLFFLSSCAWRGKSRQLALNFRCLFLLYSQKIVLLFYSLFYNKIVGPFTPLRNRIQLINILYLDRLCTSECYFWFIHKIVIFNPAPPPDFLHYNFLNIYNELWFAPSQIGGSGSKSV